MRDMERRNKDARNESTIHMKAEEKPPLRDRLIPSQHLGMYPE